MAILTETGKRRKIFDQNSQRRGEKKCECNRTERNVFFKGTRNQKISTADDPDVI